MLCLADHQSYKLINLSLSSLTPLTQTPQMPSASANLILGSQLIARPLVAVVKKDEFLIVDGGSGLNQQTIGICLNANGDPVRGTLQWSNYPKSICVEFPYVVALLSNYTIEIHNIQDQTLLQKIPIDNSVEAKGLVFGHGIKVWMDSLAKSLKRTPWKQQLSDPEIEIELQRETIKYSTIASRILVYGKDSVMAQVTTPLTIQVDGLLENSLVEEAMQLADQARNTMSEEDYDTVYAERLKHELNYTFQKSGMILLKETLFDDAFSLLSKGNIDPRIVVQMFEGLMQDQWINSPPPILLFDSIHQLIENFGNLKNIVDSSITESQETDASEMRRVLLENAREALSKYLVAERDKRLIKSAKNSMICEVIDTCLLQVYMSREDFISLYKFLQHPNSCNVEYCSEILLNAQKYYALSIMYESKLMYEKTLELWTG
ncbi:hypothetical protein BY458DRAFT_64390 [Sporodiniella umbellata]|nr:hypothetical protein BY458DRAFT_64390 [Sporodiniella umbellata]